MIKGEGGKYSHNYLERCHESLFLRAMIKGGGGKYSHNYLQRCHESLFPRAMIKGEGGNTVKTIWNAATSLSLTNQ